MHGIPVKVCLLSLFSGQHAQYPGQSVLAVPVFRTACTVSRSKCACCPCFPDSMHGMRGMKRLGRDSAAQPQSATGFAWRRMRDSAAQPAAACAIPGEGVSKHHSLRNLKVPGCFVSCTLCEQAPNGAGNENSPALCAELRCFERKTGFGPATSTLARLRSTN